MALSARPGQHYGLFCTVLVLGCFDEPPSVDDGTASDTSDMSTSASSAATSVTTADSSTTATPSTDVATAEASSADATGDASSSAGTRPSDDAALGFTGAGFGRTVEETSAAALAPAFTVELWVNIEDPASTVGMLVDARSASVGPGGWAFYVDPTSRVLSFAYLTSRGDYVGPEGPAVDSLSPGWHHVAATRELGNGALFIDGEVYGAFVAAEEPAVVATRLTVGDQVTESPTWALRAARIDDLRVSSAALYSRPFEPPAELSVDSSSQLLWRFDEGSGDVVVDDVVGLELQLQAVDWADGGPT